MLQMELGSKWQLILELTHSKLPPPLWESTIHSGLLPLQMVENTLQLGVMQNYIKNYIEQNELLKRVLLDAVHQIIGPTVNVDIIDMSTGLSTMDTDVNHKKETTNTNTNEDKSSLPLTVEDPSNTATIPPVDDFEREIYIKPVYPDPILVEKPVVAQKPSYPTIPEAQTKQIHTPIMTGNEEVDLSQSSLNPDYTFDNFIVGNSTRYPFSVAQAVAENPAVIYNPLFIYGESGLGKTHLMHAIGNDILHRYPDKKIMCITSEALMNTFVDSIKRKTPESFRNTFRNIDVLLVDDIQFFDKKGGTQEEFFHTFNALKNDKKQIVLTSDTLPKDMKELTDRLRTRFEEGVITTINPPDRETRIAILQSMIEHHSQQYPTLYLDTDTINFLALSFKDNIRSLKGAFNTLLSAAMGEGRIGHIDLAFAQKTLADRLPDAKRIYLTIEGIQDFIASYFSIKKSDLLGTKRNKQFVVPRQIAMYLCRELINESFPQIGVAFGKDHTTILHAYTKVTKELEKDPALKDTVEDIKEKIRTSV